MKSFLRYAIAALFLVATPAHAVKISALTAGSALSGTEVAAFVQSGTTVKITANQIKTFVQTPWVAAVDAAGFNLRVTDSTGVASNESGNSMIVEFNSATSADNYWALDNGTAGLTMRAEGADTDVSVTFGGKNAGTVCLGVSGACELVVDVNTARPGANDGASLGVGATAWSDLFLANGALINFNNGEVNFTHMGVDLVSLQGGSFGMMQDSGTISSDSIGFSRNYVVVDTEGAAATDNLATMTAPPSNTGAVTKYIQAANDARTVVIKGDSSGNISGANGGDCILDDNEDMAELMFNSTLLDWVIVSCDNGDSFGPVAASDEVTALTTGTGKVTWRMPYAFRLTEVRCSLTTAQTSGSIFTVDINESGTTVISTKVTIDNTEKTSTTAATASVISDAALADDAEMTIDIDQVGDGTAKGLKCSLLGRQS